MKKVILLFTIVFLFISIFTSCQTSNSPTASDDESGIVEDIDGNTYETVEIGNQIWMAENLRVTHYRSGTGINFVTGGVWSDMTSGAYCAYDNSESTAKTYGYLYNWYAVTDGRNIAPEGWHMPTEAEWKELELYLDMSQAEVDKENVWRGTDEGGKLKEAGTTHWASPNTGATNVSGFSAIPGGYRHSGGTFSSLGASANFWASTEHGSDNAWRRLLGYNHSDVYKHDSNKHEGYSVRLIRD